MTAALPDIFAEPEPGEAPEVVDDVVVPHSAVLTDDAQFIRGQWAGIEHGMLAIADRLRDVRDREGWTVRRLAEWCETEQLGIAQSRVGQLLQYATAVESLTAVGALSTTVDKPSEWTLRPLAQEIGRGMTPEAASDVWKNAVTLFGDDPANVDVAAAVGAATGRFTLYTMLHWAQAAEPCRADAVPADAVEDAEDESGNTAGRPAQDEADQSNIGSNPPELRPGRSDIAGFPD